MRRFLQWTTLVLGIAACLAISYAAYQLAGYSWLQVVDYRSPYLGADPSLSPTVESTLNTPPISKRVLLVIVDGLREDVSRSSMSNLNTLRGYGGDYVLTVPQPSLSYPNWTTILTGAPPEISGVTTNWYTGRVRAPTLMELAARRHLSVGVVGPTDFTQLFGLTPGPTVSLRPWPKGGYLSTKLVDDAIGISKRSKPKLLIVHLPDLDNAGHEFGGASPQYREVAKRIDHDLQRLVSAVSTGGVTVIVTADHGHTNQGGHGGWEASATHVPFVMFGSGVRLSSGTGELVQVAPTVSALLGMAPPPYASGQMLSAALSSLPRETTALDAAHHAAFGAHYALVVSGGTLDVATPKGVSAAEVQATVDARIARERQQRLPYAAAIGVAAALVLLLVFATSWRAGVAVLGGAVAYYAVYNALFFGVHRYLWSLSAFNKDTQVKAFMNGRLAEAAIAGLIAAAVAALLYPLMRRRPKGPRDPRYLGGWLSLGPATVLAVQATLALQVAWFLWAYGAQVVWRLPDLMWGFKYDLDLVQATGLGAAALLAPLVTYLVGRYHPRVTKPAEE